MRIKFASTWICLLILFRAWDAPTYASDGGESSTTGRLEKLQSIWKSRPDVKTLRMSAFRFAGGARGSGGLSRDELRKMIDDCVQLRLQDSSIEEFRAATDPFFPGSRDGEGLVGGWNLIRLIQSDALLRQDLTTHRSLTEIWVHRPEGDIWYHPENRQVTLFKKHSGNYLPSLKDLYIRSPLPPASVKWRLRNDADERTTFEGFPAATDHPLISITVNEATGFVSRVREFDDAGKPRKERLWLAETESNLAVPLPRVTFDIQLNMSESKPVKAVIGFVIQQIELSAAIQAEEFAVRIPPNTTVVIQESTSATAKLPRVMKLPHEVTDVTTYLDDGSK